MNHRASACLHIIVGESSIFCEKNITIRSKLGISRVILAKKHSQCDGHTFPCIYSCTWSLALATSGLSRSHDFLSASLAERRRVGCNSSTSELLRISERFKSLPSFRTVVKGVMLKRSLISKASLGFSENLKTDQHGTKKEKEEKAIDMEP